MRHDDLEAVRREPARIVRIDLAVASASRWSAGDDLAAPQIAHDSECPDVTREWIFRDVRHVPAIRRKHEIVKECPHVGRDRLRLERRSTRSQAKDFQLGGRGVFRDLDVAAYQCVAYEDREVIYLVENCVITPRRITLGVSFYTTARH